MKVSIKDGSSIKRAATLFAASKIISDKEIQAEARGLIIPGEYTDFSGLIEFRVHEMLVSEDYETHRVQKANPWKLLAVALSKQNAPTIEALVREVEARGVDSVAEKSVKSEAKKAIERIKQSTRAVNKGPVKVFGSWNILR